MHRPHRLKNKNSDHEQKRKREAESNVERVRGQDLQKPSHPVETLVFGVFISWEKNGFFAQQQKDGVTSDAPCIALSRRLSTIKRR